MTVLWAIVIAGVTFLVTLVAWLVIGIASLMLQPAATAPQTSEGATEYLIQSMSDNFATLSAVQGLTVLAMVCLLTRQKDGLTRARMLRLQAISLRRCALWAVGGLAVVFALGQVPEFFVDVDDHEALAWLSVLQPVWIGFIVLVFIGPISEEVLFRGFIYGGLAQSAIGPVGAIVISSAVWAVAHLQYTWLIIAIIFMYGVVFGIMRWKSASLWPPIVAHCVVNLISGMIYYSGLGGT